MGTTATTATAASAATAATTERSRCTLLSLRHVWYPWSPAMDRARAIGWICGAVLTVASSTVAAQVGTDAARRALIEQAREASRAGDHARAVELATRAAGVRATPSLRYFLAREHQALGRAVEALEAAGECAARARVDATIPDQLELLARCEAIVREAEAQVARLTVRVPSPPPDGLQVHVGGAPLAVSLYGIAVPIAPGAVDITATAPGRRPYRTTRTLVARTQVEVSVELAESEPPATAPIPASATPSTPPGWPEPVAPPARAAVVPPRPPAVRVTASAGAGPWIVGATGLAALATAGAVLFVANDARDARDAACPSANDCDPVTAAGHDGRYRDFTLGADVAFALGGALVAGAVVWWAVARSARPPSTRASLTPAGLVLRW